VARVKDGGAIESKSGTECTYRRNFLIAMQTIIVIYFIFNSIQQYDEY